MLAALLASARARCPCTQPGPRSRPTADRQVDAGGKAVARRRSSRRGAGVRAARGAVARRAARSIPAARGARVCPRRSDTSRPARCSSKSAPRCRRADFALRAQVVAELASADCSIPKEHWPSSIAFRSRCRAKTLSDMLALRARALFALNRPAAGVTTALERERTLDQPGRSARQSAADLARLAAERRRQCGFHPPPGASATVDRLARSRSRSAGRRAQSVHRERRSRRLARPLSVASGELAAERRRAARARRRPRLSDADRADPAAVGSAAGAPASRCATDFSRRCCSRSKRSGRWSTSTTPRRWARRRRIGARSPTARSSSSGR